MLGDLEVRLLPVRVELVLEEVEVGDELLEEGLVHDGVEGAQQREDRDATLARDARAGVGRLVLLLFEVDLQPLTAARVDRAFEGDLLVLARLEHHARGPHELTDHDALGAVDDERSLFGHDREVAHEDGLLFDLAGLAVQEARANEDRLGVGGGALTALFHGELRRGLQVRVVGVELQFERESSGEVGDRRDGLEGLAQTLFHEQVEAVSLNFEKVRQGVSFTECREVKSLWASGPRRQRSLLRVGGWLLLAYAGNTYKTASGDDKVRCKDTVLQL